MLLSKLAILTLLSLIKALPFKVANDTDASFSRSLIASNTETHLFKALETDIFAIPDVGAPDNKNQKQQNVQVIHVSNYDEIESNYLDIVHDKNAEVLFVLSDSGNFLARVKHEGSNNNDAQPSNPKQQPGENIDAIGQSAGWPFKKKKNTKNEEVSEKDGKKGKSNEKKSPPKSGAGEDSEWVEFKYTDVSKQNTNYFIPVSSCQSQEYGKGGSIGFGWSLGSSVGGSNSIGLGFSYDIFTLSLTVGISLSTSVSVSGSTSCSINKGTVGQIWMKPETVSGTPHSRRARFSGGIRKFLTDGEFRQHTEMIAITQQNLYEIVCATSDVVPLYCDSKLGDLSSPIDAKYNQMSLHQPDALL